MRRDLGRRVAATAIILIALVTPHAPAARAGQVRVNVGVGGNNFSPYAVNLNQGDQVVWVWIAGNHTVTNWSTASDSEGFTIDGSIFDSDAGGNHFGQNSTTRYSWKSDRTGNIPYLCVPHVPGMNARLIVSPLATPPTIAVSNFRLTEVQFNVPGGQDLIEIANLGAASGDLRSYRLAVAGTGTGVVITNVDFPMAAGTRVTLHTGQSGTNTASDIFLPAIGDLGDAAGSVALYVPSSLAPLNALTNKDLMIDFVQWGAGGQPNETTAGLNTFWTAGTSINNVAPGHSIEYCANPTLDHGVARWAEISPPNFGGNSDCTTPVHTGSWGRLKVLYR